MNNQKLFRLFRTAALLTIISLFAAITFEAFHTGHEDVCHQENCPVCLVLQIIHSTNKITDAAPMVSVEFSAFSSINLYILSALLITPATLVKQKIKLVI